MRVDAFDFELPPDRIALAPASPRDSARMLVLATDGAIAYARTYTTQQMGQRSAAVLLVTDGNPTGCNQNGVTQAVAAAQAGFMGTPSIKTFVVGMGNTAALSMVALAGSGGAL